MGLSRVRQTTRPSVVRTALAGFASVLANDLVSGRPLLAGPLHLELDLWPLQRKLEQLLDVLYTLQSLMFVRCVRQTEQFSGSSDWVFHVRPKKPFVPIRQRGINSGQLCCTPSIGFLSFECVVPYFPLERRTL